MSFVSDKAVLGESVSFGKNFYAAPFCVLNDDEGSISIGNNVNVQEFCVLHAEVSVGNNVTVGHAAVLHGCKIGSNVLIGLNATVLDGAVVKDWSIIAAGSVVIPGSVVEGLWAGVPAKKLRDCTQDDKKLIESSWRNYVNHLREKGFED
ncbi:MAG: gamma carbonic anhydrase family protein [Candidatus Micrarchaeota archaeon]